MKKYPALALLIASLLLTLAGIARAEVNTLSVRGSDGYVENWAFRPFGAGPYMGNWTNGELPEQTGIKALDNGEYADKVWTEDNNASPINFAALGGYIYPTFKFTDVDGVVKTYNAAFVPSPGGSHPTDGTISTGERFDVEMLAWRMAGKKGDKDRIQVLIIHSFDPTLGRDFNGVDYLHLGDIFIDTNGDGKYDRALTTGQWTNPQHHDPVTGALFAHSNPIGLYSVAQDANGNELAYDIVSKTEHGWYETPEVMTACHPFALTMNPANVKLADQSGTLEYSVYAAPEINNPYGRIFWANENKTWIQEWTFNIEDLGFTGPVTVKQLKENLHLHVTTECGNDFLDCQAGVNTGKIGDTVYYDINSSGHQDVNVPNVENEPGLPGVTVVLKTLLDDGITWAVYGSTTTDGDGIYLFSNLAPGIYKAEVDPTAPILAGMSPRQTAPDKIILGKGQSFLDADFGFVIPEGWIVLTKSVGASANGPWDDANIPPGPAFEQGGNVWFQFVVTNRSNVILDNFDLTDTVYGTLAGFNPTYPETLAPNESFTYVYGPVPASVLGTHNNVGIITGTTPFGHEVKDTDPANYEVIAPSPHNPHITIVKYVSAIPDPATWDNLNIPKVLVGSPVYFRYLITNDGDAPLTNVTLTDNKFNKTSVPPFDPPEYSLEPGQSVSFDYGLAAALVGEQTNVATVVGYYEAQNYSDDDDATYIGVAPLIDIAKSVGTNPDPADETSWDDADAAPGPDMPVGGNIYFKFVITNTGTGFLTDLHLSDSDFPLPEPLDPPLPKYLLPGESYTYVYGPVEALPDHQVNTATVTATSEVSTEVSASDDANYTGRISSIQVIKWVGTNTCLGMNWNDADITPGPHIKVGTNTYFKFEITNTGNLPLTDVKLTDSVYDLNAAATPPNPPEILMPGATYTYFYGPVPAVANQHTNIATAKGVALLIFGVEDTNPANYFGIVPTTLRVGDTATIGFWHNKNGQKLILTMNGSSSSKLLATWLAEKFPHLYGIYAGQDNLTGKTNVEVAALFQKFFARTSQKTDAQILAVALAVYVTNPVLAGGAYGSRYGFTVTGPGTATKTVNVSYYGSEIGLVDDGVYAVWDLLLQAELQKSLGSFNNIAFNFIFDRINNTGDIR